MSLRNSLVSRVSFAAVGLLGLISGLQAQSFTKADSGWVRIFNGNNFDGLYSRVYGATAPLVHPPVASIFTLLYPGTDTAVARVNSTTPGNLGTDDTTFSHYRVRVEVKFDALGTPNGGLLYHLNEKATRMSNNWSRSIEFQGKIDEAGSAFSIQQVTFTSRTASSGSKLVPYSPTGSTLLNACEIGCPTRSIKGNPLISNADPAAPTTTRWLRYQLITRGADSAIHMINDTVVLKLWNIRIFNDSTASASNKTPNGPWDHGALALQAEGALVNYRRWEVMRIPPTTPMNENYLHRLFLDLPAAKIKPAGGSQVAVTWRSIGTIPRVKIEYRVGTGGWQTAVDSVPNTGSYTWTAPASVPDSVNMRITSRDYVWGDSTSTENATGIRSWARDAKGPLLTLRGGELLLPGAPGFDRAEIRDAAGKLVRALQGGSSEFRWNLADAQGARVRPGFYFVRLTGPHNAQNARVLVF